MFWAATEMRGANFGAVRLAGGLSEHPIAPIPPVCGTWG